MATEHQERIDIHTDPRIVHEHVLRYRFSAPVLQQSEAWIDLGCGGGLGAAIALGDQRVPEATLLVDFDEAALEAAREALGGGPEVLCADLASESQIDELERAAAELFEGRRGCLTCFEVIEHLDDFSPLVGLLRRMTVAGATVVMSVPNDSFWSMHNPHHKIMWGGEAFEEFRTLLPEDAVVAHQFALTGSCIQPLGSSAADRTHALSMEILDERVPTHYLIAFGPQARGVAAVALVEQSDLSAHRAWERQRDANLEWLSQRVEDLVHYEAEARRLREEVERLRPAGQPT